MFILLIAAINFFVIITINIIVTINNIKYLWSLSPQYQSHHHHLIQFYHHCSQIHCHHASPYWEVFFQGVFVPVFQGPRETLTIQAYPHLSSNQFTLLSSLIVLCTCQKVYLLVDLSYKTNSPKFSSSLYLSVVLGLEP